MTKTSASNLAIQGLELSLHLGWPENERLKIQTVLLDIDIQFPEAPAGCVTDKLEDTLCYAKLSNAIREQVGTRHFHLIEHLSCELHKMIKPLLPKDSRLTVHITKRPKIPGLTGGVRFSYWEKE